MRLESGLTLDVLAAAGCDSVDSFICAIRSAIPLEILRFIGGGLVGVLSTGSSMDKSTASADASAAGDVVVDSIDGAFSGDVVVDSDSLEGDEVTVAAMGSVMLQCSCSLNPLFYIPE